METVELVAPVGDERATVPTGSVQYRALMAAGWTFAPAQETQPEEKRPWWCPTCLRELRDAEVRAGVESPTCMVCNYAVEPLAFRWQAEYIRRQGCPECGASTPYVHKMSCSRRGVVGAARPWDGVAAGDVVRLLPEDLCLPAAERSPAWTGRVTKIYAGCMTIEPLPIPPVFPTEIERTATGAWEIRVCGQDAARVVFREVAETGLGFDVRKDLVDAFAQEVARALREADRG